jgi:hypothetical protein
MSQDLKKSPYPAGVNTALACIPCWPGTYQTGKGQNAAVGRMRLLFLWEYELLLFCLTGHFTFVASIHEQVFAMI